MQSPKAGVFNKLKKKLTKGLRYELGNTSDDCDSTNVKFSKIEAMYGKIPTQDGQLSVSSRDSSPNVRDSPKRSVLDSPQRANLSEKDTNKTNTYTKDPTKDQKKSGSPTKEAKCNKETGPIIFINNTYDLPPVLPIKKGAISDKRQRSKERSKDHGCNKDGKKAESDKQNVGNDHSDENKENSKVIPSACKSPFKSKKEKVNSSLSSKIEIGNKQGSSCNSLEDGEFSLSNSRGSSSDGRIKEKSVLNKENDIKSFHESVTVNGFKANCVELELVNSKHDENVLSNDLLESDPEENYLIVKMPKGDSINNKVWPPKLCNSESTLGNDKDVEGVLEKMESPYKSKKENEHTRNLDKGCNMVNVKSKPNVASPPPIPPKPNVKPKTFKNNTDKTEKYNVSEKRSLNYGSGTLKFPKEVNRLAEKGKRSSSHPIANDDKSKNDISKQSVVISSDKAVHNTYSLTDNGSAGNTVKNHSVPLLRKLDDKQKATTDTCNSLHDDNDDNQGRDKKSFNCGNISKESNLENKSSDSRSEYISIEDYGVAVKKGKIVAQSSNDSDDMDVGYTSLADVEKIFGSKDKNLSKQGSPSMGKSKTESVNDDNGNVMKNPGHVIKCDVNIQGCDVRPLLRNNLMKRSYQGNVGNKTGSPEKAKVESPKGKRTPPPLMRKIQKPLPPAEENEYGSIGDYSSNKNDTNVDNVANNKHYGARPKLRMPRISDDYVQCDSPIVTKVTVVRDMPLRDDSDTDGYTDLSEKSPSARDSSSSSNLDVNLNVEVERGISHESGYETGGSGLRSHSSSSNEFIQNDLSNYSLMSEQGDDVLVNQGKENLNDSTSSEETNEMLKGPVYRETIERLENTAVVANLYAFIPKGLQRSYEATTSDGDNGGDSEVSGSTDKTETHERSTIHSPDSITIDTLIDDIDSDAYTDEVDYGFEDCDEEDDDYLPPIPTRNYTTDEKKTADGKNRNIEKVDNDNTPPLMRVILSNQDKISTSSKSSKFQSLSIISSSEKKSPEKSTNKTDTDSKLFTESKESILQEKKKTYEATPQLKPKPIKEEVKEESVKPKIAPDINENLLAKAKSKTVASVIKSKFSSSVSPSNSSKGTKLKSPCKESADNYVKSPLKSAKNNNNNNHSSRTGLSKYSPIRRKSYEKVERSTPIRDIENFSEKQPTSPEHVSSKSKKKETEKKKDKKASSKESLSRKEKVASLFLPDKKKVVEDHNETMVSSTTSVRSSTETVESSKAERKVPDTPSRFSDRSDELYNQSFSSDSTLSLDQQFWASFDEPVHMSVEEVMSQAKDLGIPLSINLTMRTGRTSSGSVSSGESVCSPSHRLNSQTLPCPKHGIITQDKLPRKKPGTLKDKFASLFAKKSGSTSPKHIDRGSEHIQKRSLPTPPPSCDFDVVDGTITSPSRRHRNHSHYPKSSVCQIHGGQAQTLSPGRRGHGYCFEDSCNCSSSQTNSKIFSGHGSSNIHSSPSNNICSNCNHGFCVHDSSSNRKSVSSATTHRSSKSRNYHEHHCCCQGSKYEHNESHQQNRHTIHHSDVVSNRTRHHSTGRVSHELVRSKYRDRSQSRDPMSRSRSPHVHSLPSNHSPSRHGYASRAEPRQTRSSSSSGLVERCPPSPAPSMGTSSVLSAPSAFAVPPPTPGSMSSSSAMAASISMLRDCSPTRSTVSSSNGNVNTNADFIGSLSKLKDVGWYWGPLNWDDAEAKLSTKPDGAFLVRDSSDDRYILSLSFRSQGTTHHTRIEHYKGMFSFYSQPKSHGAATIIDFIEKAMDHSRSGKFLYFLRPRAPGLPPAPVQLLFPISRFQNMQTLQHLCRFAILKHVRRDHIDQLPVPQRIKDYLEMSQYYIEYLGDDTGSR